jgi:hypothetical protein
VDEQWDDDYDEDTDMDEETIPCPYCKQQIHEDSVRCPYCENYISQEDTVPARKPWWIYIGAMLGLYVVYRWIVG